MTASEPAGAPSGTDLNSVVGPTEASTSAPTSAPAQPRQWTVVALGDSVTSGAACHCTAFPQLYAQLLSRIRGIPASAQNFGVNGLTSGGLLTRITDTTALTHQAAAGADIDLITIGANDFADHFGPITTAQCSGPDATDCVNDELETMGRNVTAILNEIHQLRAGKRTVVLVTGYWNVFQDGQVARTAYPKAGVQATKALTLRANTTLRQVATADGATFVGLFTPFNGPAGGDDVTKLLAPDGDHPNAAGHELIAQRLIAAGLPGLVPN